MPETAESHAASLTTNRNCTIEITNLSRRFCLTNPKIYMESGFNYNPPQPTVRVEKTELCSFTKDDNTASGAVGVLAYDLYNMPEHQYRNIIAVMFSVPFDYNLYKNMLAIGLFKESHEIDKKLYTHMYKDDDFSDFSRHEADGSGVLFENEEIQVRATMSDEGKAIIKLEIYDN